MVKPPPKISPLFSPGGVKSFFHRRFPFASKADATELASKVNILFSKKTGSVTNLFFLLSPLPIDTDQISLRFSPSIKLGLFLDSAEEINRH